MDILKEPSHGTPELPVAFYTNEYSWKDPFAFYSHWHDELEILYLEKGELDIYVNSIVYSLQAGELILISAAAIHYAKIRGSRDSILHALLFHPDMLYTLRQIDSVNIQYLDRLQNKEINAIHVSTKRHTIAKLVSLFTETRHLLEVKSFAYELLIKARLAEILYCFFDANKKNDTVTIASPAQNIIEKSLQYIREHYADELTAELLAEQACMSISNYERIFKRYTAQSPISYIMVYRISTAADLLRNTSLSVSDISMNVGFRNFSYFNRCFKKFMSMTPSEFRKAAKE